MLNLVYIIFALLLIAAMYGFAQLPGIGVIFYVLFWTLILVFVLGMIRGLLNRQRGL